MRTMPRFFTALICLALAGCSALPSSSPTATKSDAGSPPPPTQTPAVTATRTEPAASPTPEPTITLPAAEILPPSPTPDTRLLPAEWQTWPVVPSVSPWLKELYAQGLAEGNNPHAFSKIGDCQNVVSLFLSPFDVPAEYRLGEQYAYLQPTIEQFAGSWGRKSQAVRGGFNVASVFNPMLADPKACEKNETPLDCEFRLNHPSIVTISMEEWWSKNPAETYEKYLRQIVEYALAHKAVPILATKADNLEGDMSINAAIARVAYDYDVPLWNFWAAVQGLPNKGLEPDGFHLTTGPTYLDDPQIMRQAWPWRNLTALQAIDAVWQAVR